MTHAIKAGLSDQIAFFRAYDTDGTAKVDLTSATTGLTLSVFRVGASAVSISSLSDKAADSTAHADGAIRQVQGNLYTVDLPDAAVATQVPSICVKGTYTGGVIEGVPHPIVGYDGTAVRVGASDGTGVTLAADQEVNVTKVNGTSQTAGDLAALLATLSSYVDTEVAAIKAKTDNLPSDPADASDIAASFTTVNDTLATIAAYIDTEVSAIKSKTDNLPTDPADQSAVEAAISAAIATVPTAAQNADAVWDEEMADHTGSTTYGGRIVRAANSNVTVQITGSNHIASDVHAFQTDVIDATAFASSAVAEIQSGLATSTALTSVASDVTGIKAKTDNLPADPADASDIAASFSSIASSIATLTAYVDTEVAAIKAKTDNLPTDPADQSAVEAAITAAASLLATAAELAKVPKAGETRRFTQIAANSGAKTADVSIGDPL